MIRPPRSAAVLAPSCPCRLPAAYHVCRACGAQLDHAELVRVVGGFACRVPCRPVVVQRPESVP